MPPPITPQRPAKDKAAIAFIALMAVLLLLGGALLRTLGEERSAVTATTTTPAAHWQAQLQGAVDRLAATLRERVDAASTAPRPPAPATKPAPGPGKAAAPAVNTAKGDPARTYPAIAAPAAPHVLPVLANAGWTYDVFFGPAWNKQGQLRYVTLPAPPNKPPQATMSWIPSGGQASTWNFGVVAADHPSHANTRFPGFFMHAAYLPQSLGPNARLLWEMPWQGAAGGVRRYDVRVQGWERLALPAGSFDAVRLEGTLRYVQKESVKAEVAYTLWYAPSARQTVRLRWLGRAPDEGSTEMIAELAEFRSSALAVR